ncbi:MAG: hypothetical protein UZ01_00653 [Candidatus Brocadia sinica]|nr:MAG: hypothetical protein UZ01_00653 [Candidatus Brocadia sinica]
MSRSHAERVNERKYLMMHYERYYSYEDQYATDDFFFVIFDAAEVDFLYTGIGQGGQR